jgi:hypothetical protein
LHHVYENLSTAFELTKTCPITVKSTIFEDNNGAISTAHTPMMTPCTKHIAVKYHLVKSLFGPSSSNTTFDLQKIDTQEQKADVFTKGLGTEAFLQICKLLCNY